MMPDFMGHHVCLSKISRSAMSVFQIPVETQVDIDLLVTWAVERSHRGLRESTGGLHGTAKEHELRLPVVVAQLPEDRMPGILRIGEHDGNEILHLVVLRLVSSASTLILLLDQFRRNIHRNTAKAFSMDKLALKLCVEGAMQKKDRGLTPIQRVFFYMPLQHAERNDGVSEAGAGPARVAPPPAARTASATRPPRGRAASRRCSRRRWHGRGSGIS